MCLHAEHKYRGKNVTPTVLVVDDQPEFVLLIRDILAGQEEFQITGEAHDGYTALRFVEESLPDMVLLDVEMPGLNGLNVAALMRKRFPQVKVVLMSAHHADDFRAEGLRAGACDFITKTNLSVERLRQAWTSNLPS